MRVLKIVLVLHLCFYHSGYSQTIKLNQIGFYRISQKLAVVTESNEKEFQVINANDNNVVYTGILSQPEYWSKSGEKNICIADFSEFTDEGNFYIKSGNQTSYNFIIKQDTLFKDLTIWSLKAFYLWRASIEIKKEFATFKETDYSRPLGHPDNRVFIHESAASDSFPAGSVIYSSKGWYDAGDYNKYIVNASQAVFPLLHAYELFPDYFNKLNLNIPESNNSLPDILDEVKWETDWLLSMQDPYDGGVYTKLTTKNFSGMIMPDKDVEDRYVVTKSTAAALDFAAMLSKASRIFRKYNDILPGYADSCINAAEKAYHWATINPEIYFTNPVGFTTGGYGDNSLKDEFYWAKMELLLTTQDKKYTVGLDSFYNYSLPQWRVVSSNGILSALHYIDSMNVDESIKIRTKQTFYSLTEYWLKVSKESPYRIPLEDFMWGCNGDISSMGIFFIEAYKNTQDESFLNAAISVLDYLLGRNATSYSFVTGFGDKSPMNIHDRRSDADNIINPIPGYLVGGPTPWHQGHDCPTSNYPSTFPAKSYLDEVCSFSTNEIAINWNGPFVFLVGAIDAILSERNTISLKKDVSEINNCNTKGISDIVFAKTSEDGKTIKLKLKNGLEQNKSETPIVFSVISDGKNIFKDASINNDDNTEIIINIDEIERFKSISLSYTGNSLIAKKNKVSVFSGLQVENNSKIVHPKILSAHTLDDGFSIIIEFDNLIFPKNLKQLFNISYLQGEDTITSNIDSSFLDKNRITIICNKRFNSNSQIILNSRSETIFGTSNFEIKPFRNFIVKNLLDKNSETFIINNSSRTRIEAEKFIYNNGLAVEKCSDINDGETIGFVDYNDWVDYSVKVENDGIYKIEVRYASIVDNNKIVIQFIQDATIRNLKTIDFPKTGSWQNWKTVTQELELRKGVYLLRLFFEGRAINTNWIDFYKI